MNRIEAYREYQIDFFRKNAKKQCNQLGVEIEHFLIDTKTKESYRYDQPNGQHELMKKLANRNWRVITEEEGNLLGLEKGGHTITLEPGGQVEFSLHATSSIGEIVRAYQNILNELRPLLAEEQVLALIGYHPKTVIDRLPLLPKTRYQMMYNYFSDTGTYGHHMMKGTASTQVSIDYRDETDFIKKFRVANFLSPFIARLFDATPVFEGKIYGGENCRIMIWENTDKMRSKLVPGSLDKIFNFNDYVGYLLRTPPILIIIDGKTIYTKDETLSALLERFEFRASDYEHLTSMVFPDVRLKRFIEIRMADALPYPYNMAVPALIKGIFHDQSNLDKYYDLSLKFSDSDIIALNSRLTEELNFNYKGIEVTPFALAMLKDAAAVLAADEASYLLPIQEIITRNGSMSRMMKTLCQKLPDEFIRLITAV